MTSVVNLNRARKTRARTEAEVQATRNRAEFGRTKAQKARDRAAKGKSDAALDGHKRGS